MNSLKSSILSGCDLHCLDKIEPLRLTLYTIRANIFRTRKNFPVSNADALTGFLALWAGRGGAGRASLLETLACLKSKMWSLDGSNGACW